MNLDEVFGTHSTIGLHRAVRVVIPVVAAVAGAIALAAVGGGIGLLATGHITGIFPLLLGPAAWTAVVVGMTIVGMRSLERDLPKVIDEMKAILDASKTIPGAAATPLEGGQPRSAGQ